MLNRTLLATTNRPNHGTRSLELVSNGKTGNLTLGFAHVAYPVAVRAGETVHRQLIAIQPQPMGIDPPIMPAMPRTSGSFPEVAERPRRWRPRASKAEPRPVEAVASPATTRGGLAAPAAVAARFAAARPPIASAPTAGRSPARRCRSSSSAG